MLQYEFDLILSTYPADDQVEQVGAYAAKGGEARLSILDVTPGVTEGRPYASCAVEAKSLDDALRVVLKPLRDRGLAITRVEVSSNSLTALEETA